MLLSKLRKNERGSVIIMVMVVAAAIAGFAAYMLKSSENSISMEERDVVILDRDMLVTDINLILQSGKSCNLSLTGSFKKNEIHKIDSDHGLAVKIIQDNGSPTGEIKFQAGGQYNKLKIKSLELYMDKGSGNNFPEGDITELGSLILKLNEGKRGDTSLRIPLSVSVQTNSNGVSTILGCRVPASQETCESVEMIYDEKTGYCYHAETCDLPNVLALPDDDWTGEVVGSCHTNFNSHLKEIDFSQMRTENNMDTNGLSVLCCHPQTKMAVTCLDYEEINEALFWSGVRDGLCNDKAGGILNSLIFTQANVLEGGRTESNGFLIQCCYP